MIDFDRHPNSPYATITIESTGTEYDTRDLGLLLSGVDISDPEARRHQISVPGRDGALDFTEALGGIYFENREIVLTLVGNAISSERFRLACSTLRNALDGRMCRLVLSDDLGYYWRGRPQVDVDPIGRHHLKATMTFDAYPYKLNTVSSYEAWKWDSFSFVDGVITQAADITLVNGETKTVTLPRDPARQKVTLWLNTGQSGSVRARTSREAAGAYHLLRAGANRFPEIRMAADAETTLYLTGTGSVGVEYRIGSL